MKLKILILSVFFAAVLCSCDSRPYIVFESTSHDFGKVKAESTVSYTFNFKNAGTGTLVIEKIKAG